ncbi:hypothetical protein EON63_12825 [archaeon]|nr:MAG: hypothetical protein EON63_12825 [archaeon]
MYNAGRSSGLAKFCSKSLLLWIFIIFLIWAYILHSFSLPHFSLPTKLNRPDSSIESNVQSLLAETQRLVSEVIHANVTVAHTLRSELQHVMSIDSSTQLRFLQTQIDALKEENEALRTKTKGNGYGNIDTHTNAHTSTDTTANIVKKKWLVVGIPTVARPHNEDYLLQTLASFASQLPSYIHDEWYGSIIIHILNFQSVYNKDIQHIVYDKALEHYTHPSNPLRMYFKFTTVQTHEVPPDPIHTHTHTHTQTDRGDANHPGYIVRRQTRSIYTTIQKSMGMGEHYLFLEDDMQLCPLGMIHIHACIRA